MPHELPALPYAYNALEPYYDEQTVRLHHDMHHAAYVKGLNAAEEKLAGMLKAGDYAAIKPVCKELAFHGSGNILRNVIWYGLAVSAELITVPAASLGRPINLNSILPGPAIRCGMSR